MKRIFFGTVFFLTVILLAGSDPVTGNPVTGNDLDLIQQRNDSLRKNTEQIFSLLGDQPYGVVMKEKKEWLIVLDTIDDCIQEARKSKEKELRAWIKTLLDAQNMLLRIQKNIIKRASRERKRKKRFQWPFYRKGKSKIYF